MTIDMTKQHEKNATVKISLKAESGYAAKIEGRISAYQWGEINRILEEKPKTEGAKEST